MDIRELLDITVKNNASDLHLIPEIPPTIRVDGELAPIASMSPMSQESVESMIFSLTTAEQKELLLANKELDFSVPYGGNTFGELGRFRINAYFQRGFLCAALRYLPKILHSIEDLHMPKICHGFTTLKQGMVLVTGPTGQGKSTTLAAMINEINMGRACHILTIEDPVEYVYPRGKKYYFPKRDENRYTFMESLFAFCIA